MAALCTLLMTWGLSQGDLPLSLLGRHDLTCPVCAQIFETVSVARTNTSGGIDRDLFARALGPCPAFYRISTCPKCGYSGYESDFGNDLQLLPDVRDRILETPGLKLPEDFTPDSDPRELDATDRYALAITCYRWRGKSDEALAWLHLRLSWVYRERGSVLPPDPRMQKVMAYIERWRPNVKPEDNQADIELQMATQIANAIATGEFNRYQKPYVELALALILRRHGENRQAKPMLERLAEHDGFEDILLTSIERMRESIVQEREQQRKAATHFERALLANQVSSDNRGPACYILGELFRRLGREREAVRWYDQALKEETLPADLRQWAAQQRAQSIDEPAKRR